MCCIDTRLKLAHLACDLLSLGRPITCFKDVEDVIAAASGISPAVPSALQIQHASSTLIGVKRAAAAVLSSDTESVAALGASSEDAIPQSVKRLRAVPLAVDHTTPHQACASVDVTSTSSVPQGPSVVLTVFRASAVQEICVRLGREDGMGTGRIVHWCGAQIQVGTRVPGDDKTLLFVSLNPCAKLFGRVITTRVPWPSFRGPKWERLRPSFVGYVKLAPGKSCSKYRHLCSLLVLLNSNN